MAKGIFITGTDTEVGKTIVTAGIARFLLRHGVDAVTLKPVQTGAERVDGGLRAPDLAVHHAAMDMKPSERDYALMAPYMYEHACSPHLAGRLAGFYPEVARIQDCAEKLLEHRDALLVEGAGGVLVPLDEWTTMLQLIKALAYPVVLVARRGLGTINHTLLSVQVLKQAGCRLLGVVFNEVEDAEEDYIRRDNPDAVRAFSGVDILGNVDHLSPCDPTSDAMWQHFERCMPGLQRILDEVEQG